MKPSLSQYHHTYFHTLTSKTSISTEILVITGYDYFLNKRDLRNLLKRYCKIILIPRALQEESYLDSEIGNILSSYREIHLINNPAYDYQYQVIYKFAIQHSKVIRTTPTHEFCERFLKKIYIPDSINETHPEPLNLQYFSFGIRLIKKSLDWTVGSVVLMVTLPLCLYSAYKIRKQSPGAVFFRQKRVGIRNCEFECTKFRSMSLDAERNGAQFASKNDDRVFPWGRIMRATRIDELPQLLNIVKGEMSLIGPRPERKVFTDSFDETIPHYNLRHTVKPGISGYAQVMYPYGNGVHDARHKLMYDLYFIKNWSILLETKIALLTLWTIVSKRGL